jgi:hypothetical protein
VQHMQHPDKTTCNIRLKTAKTFETYTCNIRVQTLQRMQHQIYFCNVQIKHMQYIYETHEPTVVTCAHLLAAAQSRLVDVELDDCAKLDAMTRRSPTVHGPRLCAVRVRARGMRCGRHETRATRDTRHEARVGYARHKAQGRVPSG